MARIARIIIPNQVYLVTHGCARRGDIFASDDDRRLYLEWLAYYAEKYKMDVLAYCLMPNHVHLLVAGRRANSLAQAIGRTHMRYSRHANGQKRAEGSLWADRFASTLIEGRLVPDAARYVEQNPVRARLEKKAEKFRWSSARARVLDKKDPVLSPFPVKVKNWGGWLREDPDDEVEEMIRRNMYTGRPTGSAAFLERLEKKLGRSLVPQKRGPKPKAAKTPKAAPRKAPAKKKSK